MVKIVALGDESRHALFGTGQGVVTLGSGFLCRSNACMHAVVTPIFLKLRLGHRHFAAQVLSYCYPINQQDSKPCDDPVLPRRTPA